MTDDENLSGSEDIKTRIAIAQATAGFAVLELLKLVTRVGGQEYGDLVGKNLAFSLSSLVESLPPESRDYAEKFVTHLLEVAQYTVAHVAKESLDDATSH